MQRYKCLPNLPFWVRKTSEPRHTQDIYILVLWTKSAGIYNIYFLCTLLRLGFIKISQVEMISSSIYCKPYMWIVETPANMNHQAVFECWWLLFGFFGASDLAVCIGTRYNPFHFIQLVRLYYVRTTYAVSILKNPWDCTITFTYIWYIIFAKNFFDLLCI